MRTRWAVACVALFVPVFLAAADPTPPRAGKPQILPLDQVKPGMEATAWTVFQGNTAEPVPIEVIGVWRNAFGPRQHVIMAKMGGKAQRTGVAGGMSGSPVYYEGKLMGAVALRLSQFSPDAICGITPIESMLEIQEIDASQPPAAAKPGQPSQSPRAAADIPGELLARLVAAGGAGLSSDSLRSSLMTPIDTPLVFSGFTPDTLSAYEPLLRQSGITAVQGGSSATSLTAKPVAGWQNALNPGEAVSGILVSGDMSIAGMGTVTYNDGKKVLAFGHQFFSLGPINMPIAKTEILTVLSSAFQPNKVGNATDVVGALHQDRYTGILGELGAEAPLIPVHVKVRAQDDNGNITREKDLNFSVFVHQDWTPLLMSATLANSLQQMNLNAAELTYRIKADVALDGAPALHLSNMFAASDLPIPMPVVLGGWWGDKFNRLFLNPIDKPNLKDVNVVVDLLPQRRLSTIESAWVPSTEVTAGSEIPVKIFLRPYRGERLERTVMVKVPAGTSRGEHRIQLSDAATLDRILEGAARASNAMDVTKVVNLLNQERDNNRVYVAWVENRATYFADEKTLPNLPASMAAVLQTERPTGRGLASLAESISVQQSVPFDQIVNGSFSLRVKVK